MIASLLCANVTLLLQVYGLFVWLHAPEHDVIFDGRLLEGGASLSHLGLDELYSRALGAGIASSIISQQVLTAANPKVALIQLLTDEVCCATLV